MTGGVGSLGPNRMEVGRGCVLAIGEGDKLLAGALDDGKRNDVARHYPNKRRVLVILNLCCKVVWLECLVSRGKDVKG